MEPNQLIWRKFHIHKNDTVPFSPWLEGANRQHLAELFCELGYTKGAEIGVRSGNYSKCLLDANPNLTLYSVDPWFPYARVTQEQQDKHYQHCCGKLKEYGDRSKIVKATSMEALKIVPDDLDFVYLDANHEFDHIMKDLIEWSYKVRKGGVVSGHDYYQFYQAGIIQAVNCYTNAHNITQWYITRDVEPSFFWVK